jgi:hypothetical protein
MFHCTPTVSIIAAHCFSEGGEELLRQSKGELKVSAASHSLQAKSVMVYDPLLSPQEKAALEELGCVNIHHNEVIRCCL